MKKVLYIIPHLEKSGPVEHLFGLVKYLDRSKYEPIVLTLFAERENSKLNEFTSDINVKVIQICSSRKGLLFLNKKIASVIESERPSIVHTEAIFCDIPVSKLQLSVPWIVTLHNYPYEDLIPKYGRLIGLILSRAEVIAIKKADKIISCSSVLQRLYENNLKIDTKSIPNGIDLEGWDIDGLNKLQLREKLNIPKDVFVIISTGVLTARKNPLLVLQAFKTWKNKNTMLIMLGDGDLSEECRQYADDRIRFAGRVKNVIEYLVAADLFVSVSNSEGLPYGVLEAAYCGLPLLLSDIPQHREITKLLSLDQYLLCDRDVDAIQEGFSNANHLSGIRSVKSFPFSAEKMSNEYQAEYERLLG